MTSKVFFRAASGTDYELDIEHEQDAYCPKFLTEDETGWVQDLSTSDGWKSLIHMSHELKVVVLSFNSEVGD